MYRKTLPVLLFCAVVISAFATDASAQRGRGGGGGGGGAARPAPAAPRPSGTVGHAVPRQGPPPVIHDGHYHYPSNGYRGGGYPSHGGGYYAPYYRPYYGYGYPYYGYGYGYPYYGGFSVGFSVGLGYAYPYAGYGYYPYGYAGYGYPVAAAPGYVAVAPGAAYGGVRIEGAPPDAQVFADGYYAGIVDDFDGALQSMNLEPGAHRIEIRPAGLPPIAFEVNVLAGRTLTFHVR